MKALLDLDRPHFAAWIGLYDIDAGPGGKSPSEIPTPLYYVALCGFHHLVRHIAIKHPQYVNAIGCSYGFPLVAALCKNHVSAAELLLKYGGNLDVRDTRKQTALHKAIDRPEKVAIDAVQSLLERGTDVNARRDDLLTPLHLAMNTGELLLLLRSGVDVNAQDKDHDFPLHSASYNGRLEIARVLLDNGAKVNAKNGRGETPLHQVSQGEYESQADGVGIAQLLLDRGKDFETPLHFACFRGEPEIARLLLNHDAKVNARNNQGETPLHLVSLGEYDSPNDGVRVAELLLERGADMNAQDEVDWTPLHSASYNGKPEITQVLLHHGAKADTTSFC
ncbi:ankyrin repeat-containing domain protein [Lactarius vividus]|nr:ankyrin repeat-containing domain protein [Lactarius vividus]